MCRVGLHSKCAVVPEQLVAGRYVSPVITGLKADEKVRRGCPWFQNCCCLDCVVVNLSLVRESSGRSPLSTFLFVMRTV